MSVSLSRFQIIEGNPPNLPHKCSICGSITGTFIDFQLDLEFYGTVYFCLENCFTQLANELGYRSPKQHGIALDSNNQLRAELISKIEENEELKNAVAALRRIDSSPANTGGASGPERVQSTKDESKSDEDESGSDEQTTESGSSYVFDDDGLNQLLSNDD